MPLCMSAFSWHAGSWQRALLCTVFNPTKNCYSTPLWCSSFFLAFFFAFAIPHFPPSYVYYSGGLISLVAFVETVSIYELEWNNETGSRWCSTDTPRRRCAQSAISQCPVMKAYNSSDPNQARPLTLARRYDEKVMVFPLALSS